MELVPRAQSVAAPNWRCKTEGGTGSWFYNSNRWQLLFSVVKQRVELKAVVYNSNRWQLLFSIVKQRVELEAVVKIIIDGSSSLAL
jgi:hypothetical protein